ncbi:MAG: Sir2 family NAD-dependent protein deacetylase [Pirellulaceae bacterium]
MDPYQQVAQWLCSSGHVVAFTGAGISTESGIPDFRSPGGIWATSTPVYFDDFVASSESRCEYWRQKAAAHRDFAGSQPNVGHVVLAGWEKRGLLQGVVTQNIDGLHQLAGSSQVIELHGTARQIACLQCEERYDAEEMVSQFLATEQVPDCPRCGGMIKHATISFGQSLVPEVLEHAMTLAQRADLFLVMGSSLVVEPAASLPRMARGQGARVVIVNRDETPHDDIADLLFHEGIGDALERINQYVEEECCE